MVDNESKDPATLEYFEKLKVQDNVRILKYDGEFNYSAINNFAVGQAEGSVITLMNNDIEVNCCTRIIWYSMLVSFSVLAV